MAMDSFEMISGSSLTWVTRLSRSRISSVQGIDLSQEQDPVIHSLEDVLRSVQRVGAKQCLFSEIETVARIGEGVSFTVDKCIYQKNTVAVKHLKVDAVELKRQRLNGRLRRVLNEVRIMNHNPLRDHPNILSMLGYGWRTTENGALPYIMVEYASHGSLRHYLKSSHRDLRTKIILAGDIGAGLNALHLCGIVHGDLKLDNMVVLEFRNRPGGVIAKLCDFGHSIVLSSDKKHLRYYGTPLYNPPEVCVQETCPIDPIYLPRCDIWAYALSLWEMLSDGATYFKESWISQYPCAKSWPESLLSDTTHNTSASTDADVKNTPDDLIRVSGNTRTSPFRNFDVGMLSGLATEFMMSLGFGSAFVDRAILRKLLNRALQVNPKDRPAKITLGPLMSNWNPADVNALYAKLAIHTGSSAWSCNILRPDQEKEITWEHQVQILEDFEQIAKRNASSEEMASAAFQVGMCYMSGFGAAKDTSTSAKFLKEAEALNQISAKLFGPSLRAVIVDVPNNLPAMTRKSFTDLGSILLGHEKNSKPKVDLPEYVDIGGECAATEGMTKKTFKCYAELKSWITTTGRRAELSLLRPETLISTTPSSVTFGLLEFAIMHGDVDFTDFLLRDIDPSVFGHSRINPLITACQISNVDLVRLLLQAKANPFRSSTDGSNFFHWLFMLGSDARFIPALINKHILDNQLDCIDYPCVAAKIIDPQWPLRLLGSPLAFSISAGSLSSIATLIELGASPTRPANGPEKGDGKLSWTPIHLAVKHHSPEMICLLLLRSPALASHLDAKVVASLKVKLDQVLLESPMGTDGLLNNRSQLVATPTTFWDGTIGSALSFSTMVERMAMHGVKFEERLAETIALLPATCFESTQKDGMTPLMQAIDFNDTSVVAALLGRFPNLAHKPFLDPLDGRYTFPLHFASQIAARRDSNDALDVIKILMRFVPDHVSTKDSSGKLPLHYSVTGPFDRATLFLINNGCPINAVDNQGQTPFLLAQSASNLRTLFGAGATVNHEDIAGRTALHIAALTGSDLLVKEILKCGTKVDIEDKLGQTALHNATMKRSVEACNILLEAGALVNSRALNGDTPLHMIVKSFRRDIAQLLLMHGADFSTTNKDSFTLLHTCVLSGDLFCLNWLLAALQDIDLSLVNVGDSKQQTALHIAAAYSCSSMARALLNHGANARVLDADGNTPFFLALQNGEGVQHRSQGDRLEISTILYKNWMAPAANEDNHSESAREVFLSNKKGQTPWDLVYQQEDLQIIEFLLREAGLDACQNLRVNDKYVGDILLDLAIARNEWDLVVTLLQNEVMEMHPSLSEWARERLVHALAQEDKKLREVMIQQVFWDTWKQRDMTRTDPTHWPWPVPERSYRSFP